MSEVILVNQVRCNSCGDKPFSAHRHDFKQCECGAVAVDGGMNYLRRVGGGYTDISITISKLEFEACMSALEWCDDNDRNNLGRICAIFRALRDTGFLSEKTGRLFD